MAAPSSLPVWCTTPAVATDKDAPDAAKKATGFKRIGGVPEKPPFQDFNWYMNLVYQWVLYFSTLFTSQESVAISQSQTNAALGTTSFDPTVFRGIKIAIAVYADATTDIASFIEFYAVSNGTTWVAQNYSEPASATYSGFVPSITAAGVLQYTTPAWSGYVASSGKATIKTTQLSLA